MITDSRRVDILGMFFEVVSVDAIIMLIAHNVAETSFNSWRKTLNAQEHYIFNAQSHSKLHLGRFETP